MLPFAVQASQGCSTPCHLALALAAEFAPVHTARAEDSLDELALWLVGVQDDEPLDQLDAVADLSRVHLEPVVLSSAIDDLLLDRVAAGGAGHPLLLAIAGAEAARRAGLPVGIVAGADGAFLAHRALQDPVLVDPARGTMLDARALDSPVSWQCCHQVAARILNRIGERAERVGHVCWALRAAELRLALPFEAATRERLEADLRRVRARLN
jgi:Transglutaminase-like superfamily